MSFDEWLKSDNGQQCMRLPLTANDRFYLKNRLWWAFEAGYESSERHKTLVEAMRLYVEKNRVLKNENAKLKRMLKRIKSEETRKH